MSRTRFTSLKGTDLPTRIRTQDGRTLAALLRDHRLLPNQDDLKRLQRELRNELEQHASDATLRTSIYEDLILVEKALTALFALSNAEGYRTGRGPLFDTE